MNNSKISLRRILAFTLIGCVLFQNCSNAKLTKILPSVEMPQNIIDANFCPAVEKVGATSSKFLFVIDMSASNVGAWKKNSLGYSYWDNSVATDPTGLRFDELKKFTQGLAGQNQFAVISFSDQAGTPVLTSTPPLFQCDVQFGLAATATSQLDSLKLLNTSEGGVFAKYTPEHPFMGAGIDPDFDNRLMRATSYRNALDCAELILSKDLQTSGGANPSRYYMVFITDGQPEDDLDPTQIVPPNNGGVQLPSCQLLAAGSTRDNCYTNETIDKTKTLMETAASLSTSLHVQPVFYTTPPQPPPPPVLNSMATIGQTTALSVSDLSGLATTLQAFVSAPVFVNYALTDTSVVNLTAKAYKGKLLADSDIDGVPDLLQVSLGYQPNKSRGNPANILNGVCEYLGGIQKCAQVMTSNGITCSPVEINSGNNLGLSLCDLKALGVASSTNQDPGIDSDKDGIPDFVELIKSLDPLRNDLNDDPDGDGIVNRNEIVRGSDPKFADAGLSSDLTISFTENQTPPNTACPTGAWGITIDRVPTVSVSAYTDTMTSSGANVAPRGSINLSHETDENLVLITFKLTPQNLTGIRSQVWGVVTKVKHREPSLAGNLSTQSIHLKASDFLLLGEVQP